jgi:DNA-binding winged helix-turn-helix (wHTH) protein
METPPKAGFEPPAARDSSTADPHRATRLLAESQDRSAPSESPQGPRDQAPRAQAPTVEEQSAAPPANGAPATAEPASLPHATQLDSYPRREPLICANLEIRPDEYEVLVDGRRLGLTVREFEVLLTLAEHEDRVVRRTHLYERVWGGKMKHRERAVDVFVRKVRNKLAQAEPTWIYIHTHFGVGYRLTPEQLDPGVRLP